MANHFPPSYFSDRHQNNSLRMRQFIYDAAFMRRHVSDLGRICDVGCATGEFLESIGWLGARHGLEISDYAKSQAQTRHFNFNSNIFTHASFFDVVLFRGSLQHVDNPFVMLRYAYSSLKPGGHIVVLSFPNTRSPLYCIKQTLPFVNDKTTYFVGSTKLLSNALTNCGFEICEVDFPYWKTPYRRAIFDHAAFLWNCIPRARFVPHAFWKSQVAIVARKPDGVT